MRFRGAGMIMRLATTNGKSWADSAGTFARLGKEAMRLCELHQSTVNTYKTRKNKGERGTLIAWTKENTAARRWIRFWA